MEYKPMSASKPRTKATSYQTTILKFDKKGEKTGWTYIDVPADIAAQLKPGNKKSFRVKGMIDAYQLKGVALLPMGQGAFIMPLNAAMRKAIGKRHGAMVSVTLEEDKAPFVLNTDMMECLEDEPAALEFFRSLAGSHQKYFSKWIESAKTRETYAKRIAMTVTAMSKKQGYGEMLRAQKAEDR